MNLAGATGGLIAGLIMAGWSFGTLNASAAVLTLPVILVVIAGLRLKPHADSPASPSSSS